MIDVKKTPSSQMQRKGRQCTNYRDDCNNGGGENCRGKGDVATLEEGTIRKRICSNSRGETDTNDARVSRRVLDSSSDLL
ncbi:hypothetical protein CHS0354_003262 [Potamilus streckersoni]|uniref:Uncharacterized protein n=1 Tax=Potamilus streckersoni TaxID=2493646 RepID=A0AAE0SVA8_9BIVA|nr:hypothetical protein CHS0354_003262 [Potamilus streckersoni]